MQHLSYVEQRGKVNFPEFTAERVYMKEFYKEKGLPLYNESDNEQDKTIASYAISTIEEYLKEQGV